jgi:hypothetical protein
MNELTNGLGALAKAGGAAIGAAPSSEPVGEQLAVAGLNVGVAIAAPGVGRLFTPVIDGVAEALIGFALKRHSHPAVAIAKASTKVSPAPPAGVEAAI